MDKKQIAETISKVRASTKKRKFSQSLDIIINLKGIDLKKEDQRMNTFFKLPFNKGKKVRVIALVGKELSTKAKEVCDKVILKDDFPTVNDKAIKQFINEADYFIAQANVMPDIAKKFGRTLGTRGLMPNPKAGCVLSPTGEVKPVVENLQKTVKLQTNNEKTIKAAVGTEAMKDEELIENAFAVYNNVLHALPQEKNNISSVILKFTMGKPFVVGGKEPEQEAPKKQHEQPKEKKKEEAPKKPKKSAKKSTKKK